MKKLLCLILVFAICFCSVASFPILSNADNEDLLFVSSNCSHYTNGMIVKTLAASGGVVAGGDVVTTYRRFYGDLNTGSTITGNFNVAAPQKLSTDTALCQKTFGAELKRLYVHKGHSTDGGLNADSSDYKYITTEFDVYFPYSTSGVSFVSGGVGATGGNNGLFRANIFASSSASEFIGTFGSTVKASYKATCSTIGTNKWHHAKIVFPADGTTSDKLKLYIDGELKAESADNLPLRQGMQATYGDLYFDVDHDNGVYIDNYKMYAGNGNTPAYSKPQAQFSSGDYTVDGQTVKFAETSATVADICSSLSTAVAYKAVYDSELNVKKNDSETLAQDDVLVIANNDGIYSYYTLTKPSSQQTEENLSTVTTSGTPLPTVENHENSWSFASSASSGVSSAALVQFPNDKKIDLSKYDNGYELSFKLKHSLKGSKLLGSSQYVGQMFLADGKVTVPSFSLFQVFSNGNGFIAPSTPLASAAGQGYFGTNKAAFGSSNKYIAGMSLDTDYTFRILVDKPHDKLYYYINDQLLIDVSSNATMVNYMKNLSSLGGFKFMMRGGDGTEELIKVTISDFEAKEYTAPDLFSTVATSGDPLPTVTKDGNFWTFASSASSSLPSKAVVTFKDAVDLSGYTDGYELSYKIKHSLINPQVLLGNSNYYVSQFKLYSEGKNASFSMYQMFANGNGIIAPTAPKADNVYGAYNDDFNTFSNSNKKIAGMDLDKEYTFRIIVDKVNQKLLYYIDDCFILDASVKTTMLNYMLGLKSISGFDVQLRGGDGSKEIIKLTISDMKASEYVPEVIDDKDYPIVKDTFASELLQRKDEESGIAICGNLLNDPSDASTWGKRGANAAKIVLENETEDEIRLGNIIRYHGITKNVDLSKLKDMELSENDKIYGKISFNVKKLSSGKTDMLTLHLFANNSSTGADGEDILAGKLVGAKYNEWKNIETSFDLIKAYELLMSGNFDTLRFEIRANNNNNSTDYSDYSEYLLSDIGIYLYMESNDVNIAVNESNILKKVDDKLLGTAYEIHNSLKSYGALTASATYTDQYMNIVKDIPSGVVRLGGFSYNYNLWKNKVSAWNSREAYQYRSSTMSQTGKMPAQTTGILEDLALAYANGPCDIIYNINMWSAKPSDAVPGIAYIPTEIVTIDPSGNPVINEEYLNKSIQDALDMIRFLTLEPSDPRAVGSDSVNWAQKRVALGYTKPVNVIYWELGNELYYRRIYDRDAKSVYDYVTGGGDEKSISKDFSQYPDVYVNLCKKYMDAIRAEFPDVKFLAQAYDTWSDWNNTVIPELGDFVDGLTYHMYYSFENSDLVTNDSIKRLNDLIGNINKFGYGDKLKIHLTEFGLSMYGAGYTGPYIKDSGQALYFAAMMNRLLQIREIETAQYFMGCYLMVDMEKENSIMTSTPIRKMLAEYMDSAKGEVIETRVSGDFEWHRGDVTSVAFKTDDGIKLFVSNTSAWEKDVSFEGIHTYTVKNTKNIYYDTLYNTYRESPDGIHMIISGAENLFGGLILPAYTTVIINLKETDMGMTSGKSAIYLSGRKSDPADTVTAILYTGTDVLQEIDVQTRDDGSFNLEFNKNYLRETDLSLKIKFGDTVYDTIGIMGNDDFVVCQSRQKGEGKKFIYVCTAGDDKESGMLIFRAISKDGNTNAVNTTVPFRNSRGYVFDLNEAPDIDKVFVWDNFDNLTPLSDAVTVK